MTAQKLLDELLDLQKQGFDLDELDVRYLSSSFSSYPVTDCEVDDSDLILYND